MIVTFYIVVTILGSAFSLPFTQSGGSGVSEFKRNARLQQGTPFDIHEQAYAGDLSLDEQLDHDEPKRKLGGLTWEDIFAPQKLWTMHCAPNCQTDYYSDLRVEDNPTAQNNDDILLHLSADKDLMQFLQWTMEHLGSLHSYNNASGNYYPGLNMWKKLNLSGRRELPLYVEEPQYIVVRREPDDLEPHVGSNPEMPFIPPRGRKYIPNLENLMSRYELFVPNRGKKDKIKDIFKYDDLFFPNRGKKRINNGGSTGEGKSATLDRYYYQSTENDRKKLHQPFADCFTRCDDITSAPPPPSSPVVTDQAENINGLVSASTLHLLPSLQVSSSALDADVDGHQDAVGCGAGAVAECQKENDVKINGFDQSVKAQIHQRQHSKGGASVADSHRDRRLLSSASASVEAAGASSFLPLIRPDQVRRLQSYPIRNKQWRDYNF